MADRAQIWIEDSPTGSSEPDQFADLALYRGQVLLARISLRVPSPTEGASLPVQEIYRRDLREVLAALNEIVNAGGTIHTGRRR